MQSFLNNARMGAADSNQHDGSTLVQMLNDRSRSFGDRLAFQFFDERSEEGPSTLTYAELDQAARRIAGALRERFQPGSGAALVYPPGLDFVKAFFGCVYAGVVAIPATYPKPRRPSARLSAIISDARPSAILTTERVIEKLADSTSAEGLEEQTWLSTDELESGSAEAYQRPEIQLSDVAFLQYTSGSTKNPRGVAVSHENIAHNLEMIRRGFGLSYDTAEVGLSWLPAYHDMGLIGGILESLYVGGTTVLMSPLSFLQRPARWLQAISEHRAVVSGGPNFAYELCLRKIKPHEIKELDLSSWQVAFSGAEPIRATTLRRFAEVFGRCGFSESAFYPCYGLAEATLLVTGGDGPGQVTTCTIQAAELQRNGRAVDADPEANPREGATELVGCGRPLMDEEVLIVDPETRRPCGENVVGEIWIRGRNVAKGYFSREGDATFHGHLAGSHNGSYLRSGDLGFMRDGSLFVTGRSKELLIIRGRNHFPHDLEATVQSSDERLIPGGGGAFLVERQGDELLVLVQEVDRATKQPERESIIREIRRNVTAEHDVFVHEVILIRMGTLPRTTSGKVRYAAVRQQYRDGDLSIVARWSISQNQRRSDEGDGGEDHTQPTELAELLALPKIDDPEALADEIQTRLMTWLGQTANLAAKDDFGPQQPFADYGLDSLSSMELIAELENALELKLSPTVAWTYPTPASLSRHLAELLTSRKDAATPSAPAQPAEDTFDQLLSQLEQMPEDEVAAMLATEDRPEAAE